MNNEHILINGMEKKLKNSINYFYKRINDKARKYLLNK